MKKMVKSFAVAVILTAGLAGTPAAHAQGQAIVLEGDVKHEKVTLDDGGQSSVELVDPETIVPGDKLIFTTAYSNTSSELVENFVVTNPLPAAVRLASDAEAGLSVSIDGGKSWGILSELRLLADDGTERAAKHEDVTHVRWTLASVAPGESGRLSYPAIIR